MKEYSSPEIQVLNFDAKMDVIRMSNGDNDTDFDNF